MGFYCGSDGKESTWNVGDLGWEIPWSRTWQPTPVFLPGESPCTEETGGLQSMGSQRAGHDWATKHNTAQGPSITADWLSGPLEGGLSLALASFCFHLLRDPWVGENYNSKRYMHPNNHCSTIYNSQNMEATLVSINSGMDKEDVVCICNGILLSHNKNEIM